MNDNERFDKFTGQARKVFSLAQEEAQLLNHPYVGGEHLLLGLVREGDGVAAKVLSRVRVTLDKARSAVESITGRGNRTVAGEIGLTPRARTVIELAVVEARRLSHHYIGTEHLLLGLLRESEGIAAGVLVSLGVNLEMVRVETIQVLNQSGMLLSIDASRRLSPHVRLKLSPTPTPTPTIDQMGIDLTAQARQGKPDTVIGLDREIERVMQILSRRQKNNAALIGEAGVDKTAIVRGLAQRIISNEVPETLAGKRLLTLDVGSIGTGTNSQGEFEERLKKIVDEIRSSQGCIIFLDEMHTVLSNGAAEGAIDTGSILRPALIRGEIQCIGAATQAAYRTYIESDPALRRWFQAVIVPEQTEEAFTVDQRSAKGATSESPENHPGRFVTFTEQCQKVLSLAQEEAQRFNHTYVGTEHLLLGLLREDDGVPAQVFSNLSVEVDRVRSAVEIVIDRPDRIVLGHGGLTPGSKKVIELTVDEARRLNHHHIGTEHLLLGLLREGEGVAASVLQSFGMTVEKVQTETIQILNQSGNSGDPTTKDV